MTRNLPLALVLLAASATSVPAQTDCQQQIEAARRAYVEGNFDRVLTLTEGCVADRAASEDANALRARTFVALDRIDEAEKAVRDLLGSNPQFAPGSDDSRRFAALIARINRELAKSATSSVSKMNESVLEAPATVVVVTAEQIRRRGYLDLEAVLHDLPGFDIARTNGQNYSNIYQRGYRSDATNRTLFIVDGVEQNDLYSNIAHISRQYPLSSIDRIEVVYGPASTMYGANAFLGVINVITKEPDDVLGEGKPFDADVHVGGGAFNTKLVDATVAGRFRDATFSLTGRAHRSDEWDLSKFTPWSYNASRLTTPDAVAEYQQGLTAYDSDFNLLTPTPADIAKAAKLDALAASEGFGRPLRYSDLTDDWMLSGKLKMSNFMVGFEAWRRREGAAASSTAFKEPGARDGNVWIPHQTAAYVRYNAALSGNVSLSYFGQAKVHGLGQGSSAFSSYNYIVGPLNLNDLNQNTKPYTSQTILSETSSQFRNELNLVYRHKNTLSVVGGVDLRNGSIQSNYSSATNCPPPPPSVFKDYDPKSADTMTKAILGDQSLFTSYVFRLIDLLIGDPRAQLRCEPRADLVVPAITSGGEHFAVRDLGLFTQVAYKPVPELKLVAGIRMDNDHIDPVGGFGTVGTPRLGAVFSKRGFVFKTIYSEAFKDPSSLEKFSTVPGVRDVPSPGLRPERAKNFEISAGRQWPAFTADVTVYRSAYSDLISLRNRNVADHPAICVRDASGTCVQGAVVDALNETVAWFSAPAGSQAETDAAQQLARLFAGLSPKVFNYFFSAPLVTSQYVNAGALRIWGVQASASGQLRGVDLFGNYTYSSPFNVEPTDEFGDPLKGVSRLRVADIATHHVNVGAARRWQKFDGSVRVNYVSTRPTGAGTTVPDPLVRVANSVPKAYTTTTLTVGYDIRPGITAQVIVDNLFDSHYWDPGVGTADGVRFASSVPQPGRSAFVRLLTRF